MKSTIAGGSLTRNNVIVRNKIIYLLLIVSVTVPSTAHAYADPGSGQLLLQVLGSFFVGLIFYFRRIFYYLTLLSG